MVSISDFESDGPGSNPGRSSNMCKSCNKNWLSGTITVIKLFVIMLVLMIILKVVGCI